MKQLRNLQRSLRISLRKYYFWGWVEVLFTIILSLGYVGANRRKFKENFEREKSTSAKRILIPLVETVHAKIIQLLIIGVALKIRGHKVYVLVCDAALPICELRNSSTNEAAKCTKCVINQKTIVTSFGLEVLKLSTLIEAGLSTEERNAILKDPGIRRCIDESVTRHFYGNMNRDHNEIQTAKVLHSETAVRAWTAAKKINSDIAPDIVIGYMLVYTAWEPMLLYFREKKKRIVSVTSHFFDSNSQIVNGFELYDSPKRFNSFCEIIDRFPDYEKEVDEFMAERLGALWRQRDENKAKKPSNENSLRRKVLICPNVHWDYGMNRLSTIFRDIEDWLDKTINIAHQAPEVDFFVRAHPAEKTYRSLGAVGVCSLIRSKFPMLPSNIRLIDADSEETTYSLMPEADVIVVMNGTVGLEALLLGMNVIVCGKAPYSYLENVVSPQTELEYKHLILNKNKPKPAVPRDKLLRFAYFYFLKTAIKWNLTKFSSGGSIYGPLNFNNAAELQAGKYKELDHLCYCILDENTLPENWI